MAQSFWTILRGLGVLPPLGANAAAVGAGQNFGKPICVTHIYWDDPGGGSSVIITDGVGTAEANILAQGDTPLDYVGSDPINLACYCRKWRDFQVTTLTGGTLVIQYI